MTKMNRLYIEVSAYYVYNLIYLRRSLLEQQIELVLITLKVSLRRRIISPTVNDYLLNFF